MVPKDLARFALLAHFFDPVPQGVPLKVSWLTLAPFWLHVGGFGYLFDSILATVAPTFAFAFAFTFCFHFCLHFRLHFRFRFFSRFCSHVCSHFSLLLSFFCALRGSVRFLGGRRQRPSGLYNNFLKLFTSRDPSPRLPERLHDARLISMVPHRSLPSSA